MRRYVISYTLGALAAASVVTPASVARADDGAEAMRIFEEAITLYNAGEYARAATGFMKAYQLKPAAVLLYNAARARGKLAGDDPAKLEAALELLERAQAQTELPLDERLSAEAAAYNDELVAQIAQARRLQAERRQAELDALKSNPDNYTRMGALGWAGVGALAAGGVSLGVAGYFNNNVRLASEALAGPDTSRAEYDRLAADFTENQDAGRAFAVIGASLMVAGAGVLVYELVTLEYDGPAAPERALARPRGRVRVGVGPMSARLEVTF